jgi:hypothetical protein
MKWSADDPRQQKAFAWLVKNHIGLAYLRDGKQRCGVSLSRVSPVVLRGHMQRIYDQKGCAKLPNDDKRLQ